jgi:hypothetical protein
MAAAPPSRWAGGLVSLTLSICQYSLLDLYELLAEAISPVKDQYQIQ